MNILNCYFEIFKHNIKKAIVVLDTIFQKSMLLSVISDINYIA